VGGGDGDERKLRKDGIQRAAAAAAAAGSISCGGGGGGGFIQRCQFVWDRFSIQNRTKKVSGERREIGCSL